MEKADSEEHEEIQASGVQAALDKLKAHPEPEANFMLMRGATAPAYNVQTAVDAEHAVIVTHAVVLDAADNRQLQPMVEAAARALNVESFHVTADAGYSNGKQAAECRLKDSSYRSLLRTGSAEARGTRFGKSQQLHGPVAKA
jgi:transposase